MTFEFQREQWRIPSLPFSSSSILVGILYCYPVYTSTIRFYVYTIVRGHRYIHAYVHSPSLPRSLFICLVPEGRNLCHLSRGFMVLLVYIWMSCPTNQDLGFWLVMMAAQPKSWTAEIAKNYKIYSLFPKSLQIQSTEYFVKWTKKNYHPSSGACFVDRFLQNSVSEWNIQRKLFIFRSLYAIPDVRRAYDRFERRSINFSVFYLKIDDCATWDSWAKLKHFSLQALHIKLEDSGCEKDWKPETRLSTRKMRIYSLKRVYTFSRLHEKYDTTRA